jgi:hypothetical protein
MRNIKKLGFKSWGKFRLERRKLIPPEQLPKVSGVYSFVIKGKPMYIGKTRNPASWRLSHYINWENRKGGSLVTRELRIGKSVEYWFLPEPKVVWKGIQIAGHDSVESYLIKTFQPPWNRL